MGFSLLMGENFLGHNYSELFSKLANKTPADGGFAAGCALENSASCSMEK